MLTRTITLGLMICLASACGSEDRSSSADQEAPPVSIDEMTKDESGSEFEAVFDAPEAVSFDRFTYANYNDVRVTHAEFDLTADFDAKTFSGTEVLDLDYIQPDTDHLILDTDDLTISAIEAWSHGEWVPVEYVLGEDDDVLGAPLEISLSDKPDRIRLTYSTSPDAKGLQWLSPEQTAGKNQPYLFSQFQTIHARSFAALQDTPAVRMTYTARIKTPPQLLAVMGAEQDPQTPRDGDYEFSMPQPIPAYLIAIAIGDIDFKAINDHIGVYSESDILDASAAEFADTPDMEAAIENLYGPYLWGRYDMIVLPPSFPFGGMENPRLSFLTPTLVAGDKSLTNVVAHELAHSWSGNLVTNATWRDAWLNEGFTSYVENRTMEALYGEGRAVMERSLDYESLKRDVEGAARPELTALKMPEDLGSTDDAFSQVSYAGGMFFLNFLESRFGRDAFDPFLKNYFDAFAFQSITTEDFLAHFEDNLWATNPDAVTKAEINAWIYEPGLPDTIVIPQSDAFEQVIQIQENWLAGDIAASDIDTSAWTTHEWLHFINSLPTEISLAQFETLDDTFDLSNAQNAEIAYAWFMKAIPIEYARSKAPLEGFLLRVGRGKFIYRLYQALVDHDQGVWARDIYDRARPGYHPIAQTRIDAIFEKAETSEETKSLEEIREESRAKIDQVACEEQGGVVRQEGLLGLYRCVLSYSDAGEICTGTDDCEGRCLGDDSVTDYQAPAGQAKGLCEADDSPFGCYAVIEDGIVTPAICVD